MATKDPADCQACKEHAHTHQCRRWGMSGQYFMRLKNKEVMDFTVEDVAIDLSEAFTCFIQTGCLWCLDELLYKCLNPDAPCIWLPRKPHPFGFRVYEVVAPMAMSNRPYCFHLILDTRKGEALDVMTIWRKVWEKMGTERELPILVTADAFFAKEEAFHVSPENSFILIATGSTHLQDIFTCNTHRIEKETGGCRMLHIESFDDFGRSLTWSSHGDSAVHNTISNVFTLESKVRTVMNYFWLPGNMLCAAGSPRAPCPSGFGDC